MLQATIMNQPLLETRDVSLRYPKQQTLAIDRLSFEIHPGRSVGLVGASGVPRLTSNTPFIERPGPVGTA